MEKCAIEEVKAESGRRQRSDRVVRRPPRRALRAMAIEAEYGLRPAAVGASFARV